MLTIEELSRVVSDKVKVILGDQLVTILNLQTQLDDASKLIGELRVELATLKNGGVNQGRDNADQADPSSVLAGPFGDRSILKSRPPS